MINVIFLAQGWANGRAATDLELHSRATVNLIVEETHKKKTNKKRKENWYKSTRKREQFSVYYLKLKKKERKNRFSIDVLQEVGQPWKQATHRRIISLIKR